MSVSRLRNPLDMHDEDWARFTAAMETMNGRDIWIVDATDLTIEQIRAVAETHKRRYPHLAMIVVDYLGLIKNRRQSVTTRRSPIFPETLKLWLCACIRQRSRLASFLAPWIPVRRPSVARLCQTSATPVLSSRTPTASCSCTAMKSTTLKARRRGSPKSSREKSIQCCWCRYLSGVQNGHFLHVDQHVGKEKTRIQLEAAKPRKQPRRYSEKYNTDAF